MVCVVWWMALAQTPALAQPSTCDSVTATTLTTAREAIAEDGFARAETLLAAAHQQQPTCVRLTVAHLAVAGWNAARAAAAKAGSPDSLATPRRLLDQLRTLSQQGSRRLEIEYGRSLLAAAMAAAQDEREEMRVHLAQARWAHELIHTVAAEDLWPLPIDEAEGELWFEVDRFADAVAAFRRAVTGGRRRAHFGLARSAAALGDAQTACDSYRAWLSARNTPVEPRQTAERYIKERCDQSIVR